MLLITPPPKMIGASGPIRKVLADLSENIDPGGNQRRAVLFPAKSPVNGERSANLPTPWKCAKTLVAVGVNLSSDKDYPVSPDEARTAAARTGRSLMANPAGRGDTGAALRGIYQNTIDEQIPDDLLSLLRKLD